MFAVYILYSPTLDSFYVGQTEDFDKRFQWHKDELFDRSHTKRAEDWTVFLIIECISRKQAVNIESHIKRMKSKKYISDLIKYPDIIEKLKAKYPE